MANSITNVGFTDYNAEQEAINRRMQMAQALQAQGTAPIEMPQTAPGGFTPHVSPFQGLAKMAQAYVGALGVKKGEEERRALAQKYQGDTSADIQQLIKALGGTKAQTIQPDPQEAQQSADYGTPQVGPANIPAQTPQEALTAALPGMRTPMGQQMATAYLTSNLNNTEKFGHTPVTMKGPDGNLVQVLVGDKGTLKPVTGYGTAPKVHAVSAGGQSVLVDEYGRKPEGAEPIAHTMTPDAQANLAFKAMEFGNLNAHQKAQLGVELQKLGLSERQLEEGRVQLVQDGDGNVHLVNRITGVGTKATDAKGNALNIPKPLTESQANANIFGTRAEAAHKIMNGLETNVSTTGLAIKRGAENIPLIGGTAGAIGNMALSPKQQQVEQAQRDFVNAVLRKESGASISPSEFQNAIKQYFPQPGDSPQVIAQKRANREIEIAGLMAAAGKPRSVMVQNPEANQPFSTDAQPKTISWNELK